MKILSIQKNDPVSSFMINGLKSENFMVDIVDYEAKALCLLEARGYDLVLVFNDDTLINGISMGQKIREVNNNIAMVLVLDKNSLELKIDALSVGFDDVFSITTPLIEIATRLKSMIRRFALSIQLSVLRFSNLEIDTARRLVRRGNRVLPLRRKEYELLEYMMHYPEQVLSRRRLLEHVWPEDTFMFTNTVDVHMASIRRKVDYKSDKKIIHTIHGVGYKISQNI